MSDDHKPPTINVEFQFSPYQDEVVIYIQTSDGSPLTAQMLCDSVTDALLLEYGLTKVSDPQSYS